MAEIIKQPSHCLTSFQALKWLLQSREDEERLRRRGGRTPVSLGHWQLYSFIRNHGNTRMCYYCITIATLYLTGNRYKNVIRPQGHVEGNLSVSLAEIRATGMIYLPPLWCIEFMFFICNLVEEHNSAIPFRAEAVNIEGVGQLQPLRGWGHTYHAVYATQQKSKRAHIHEGILCKANHSKTLFRRGLPGINKVKLLPPECPFFPLDPKRDFLLKYCAMTMSQAFGIHVNGSH